MRYTLSFLIIISVYSCSQNVEDFVVQEKTVPKLVVPFSDSLIVRKNKTDKVEVSIGLWMYRRKQLQLSALAQWLDLKKMVKKF